MAARNPVTPEDPLLLIPSQRLRCRRHRQLLREQHPQVGPARLSLCPYLVT